MEEKDFNIGDLIAVTRPDFVYIGVVYELPKSGNIKYFELFEDWDDGDHYKPTGKWDKYKYYCKPSKAKKITNEQMIDLVWEDCRMATAYNDNRKNRVAQYIKISEKLRK